MSQFSHPTISVKSQLQAHRAAWLAALLTLVAIAAVVLVLAIDDDSSTTSSVAGQSQPALRSDGGPSESSVAASVGSRPSTGPSESTIAASISRGQTIPYTGGPDESRTAASLAQSQPTTADLTRAAPQRRCAVAAEQRS